MTGNRAILGAAAFVDSAPAAAISSASTAEIREIVQRFLSACYDDLGKAPRLLDGDDLAALLRELLPRHFGKRDPLAASTEAVLGAYLRFLDDTEVVPNAYEQRRALDEHAAAFRAAVASGIAHRDGIAVLGDARPDVNRAAKVGRNDPCPCGSGKKFKKCCGLPG